MLYRTHCYSRTLKSPSALAWHESGLSGVRLLPLRKTRSKVTGVSIAVAKVCRHPSDMDRLPPGQELSVVVVKAVVASDLSDVAG